MFRMIFAILLLLVFGFSVPDQAPLPKLSDYGFFKGRLADLQPAGQVFPYEVNAPLFSDYAYKARFVALPPGTSMVYRDSTVFDFPVGAVLIKNFYYPADFAHPENGRRILETRLLLHEQKGWKALVYVWDAAQTDAILEVAGSAMPVEWVDENGKKRQLEYQVPNLNQCKGCHSYDGRFTPVGLSTRQLNRKEHDQNQLTAWNGAGILTLPSAFDPENAPRLNDYRHAGPTPLSKAATEEKARAYLDANCGYCHNPHGPANTSGLFLDIFEQNPERLGINKPPVAAGRGSGNRRFGIVPGKPGESILLYRMENDDPGIRMPEIGRQSAHREGIELIKSWIKQL